MVESPSAIREAPFRGRRRELALLEASLYALTHGQGGAVLISGRSGSGRSSLLERALLSARRDGLRCLQTTAVASERATLLSPLLDALGDRGRPALEPARLLELAGTRHGRRSAIEEVERRVLCAAERAPLVIAIDDLHHADDVTRLALRRLTGRSAGSRILWLLTSTSEREDVVAGAVRLAPLEPDAVRDLAADVLRAVPSHAVLGLVEDLGGHPAFIVELLQALVDEGLIEVDGGSARLTGHGLRQALCERGVRRPEPAAGPRTELTRSELAVAELVARGATNRQAADQLYLSPHTVSSHLRHTFEKLGIRSRVELAVLFSQPLAG